MKRYTEKIKFKDGSCAYRAASPLFSEERICKKLCEYEDLEEQGRLIILPCKIGDSVYWINNGKLFNTDFCLGDVNLLGKTIFLTQEAAEAALKESEE